MAVGGRRERWSGRRCGKELRSVGFRTGLLELGTEVNWDGNEPCNGTQWRAGVAQQRIGGPDGLHGGGCWLKLGVRACFLGRRQGLVLSSSSPTSTSIGVCLARRRPAPLMSGDLAMTPHRFTQSGRVA